MQQQPQTTIKKYFSNNYLTATQIAVAALCFPIFYFCNNPENPFRSFLFSIMGYWILLIIASVSILLVDSEARKNLKSYFTNPQKKGLLLLNFIPVILVFFVVFIKIIPDLKIKLVITVLAIAICNGTLEEIFWRGITLSKFSSTIPRLAIATLLFTSLHLAFTLLPLSYNGGAFNLVGGAAFMGIIWILVSKFTKNISFAVLAHILVNFFAFSGLFLDNGLI